MATAIDPTTATIQIKDLTSGDTNEWTSNTPAVCDHNATAAGQMHGGGLNEGQLSEITSTRKTLADMPTGKTFLLWDAGTEMWWLSRLA